MSYTGSVPDTRRRTPDWRSNAQCRKEDPELFFPKGYDGPWQLVIEHARAVCHRCPVIVSCRQHALAEGVEHGVWGGLTEDERRSLRRATSRHNLTEEEAKERAASAPKPKPLTLQELFEANTKRLIHGHLAWTGPDRPSFKGQSYSPKQVAFILDRGRQPVGRVLTTCSLSGCVLPGHIADDEERPGTQLRPKGTGRRKQAA